MKIIICDRCKAQAEALSSGYSTVKGLADLPEMDLCPDCMEQIKNFILMKAEPKKAEPEETKKKIDTGKIKALADAGWKIKEIADEMGCANSTVVYHLKKMAEEAKDVEG